jgi:uncharacterized membrane protein YozB (DUF420 family)
MKTGYKIFLIITIVFVLAGILTLLPIGNPSEKNMLGYMSHCSFAPVSTLICFILAGVSCIIRKAKFM